VASTDHKKENSRDNRGRVYKQADRSIILLGIMVVAGSIFFIVMAQILGLSQGSSLSAAPPVDPARETRFLGNVSDMTGLAQAEAGAVGQPTLVWFHSKLCHICQQIKPEVVDLGELYAGDVKFVRVEYYDRITRDALRRYRVRATPTFVLLDEAGRVQLNVAGWPGSQALIDAFEQTLSKG
jgi:thiol-disulfide isomerase/thioredoxin